MKPKLEPARNNGQTYFVTFQTANRLPLFRHERWLLLLLNTVDHFREEFLLHDYVVMEDHVHLLMTPAGPLERVVQLIKGGFSFHAKRAFAWPEEIWQRGFTDHRIRDKQDFEEHLRYLQRNFQSLRPALQQESGRSGATSPTVLAQTPPWLKPLSRLHGNGPAEAGPLQSETVSPLQSSIIGFQGETSGFPQREAAGPLQDEVGKLPGENTGHALNNPGGQRDMAGFFPGALLVRT